MLNEGHSKSWKFELINIFPDDIYISYIICFEKVQEVQKIFIYIYIYKYFLNLLNLFKANLFDLGKIETGTVEGPQSDKVIFYCNTNIIFGQLVV